MSLTANMPPQTLAAIGGEDFGISYGEYSSAADGAAAMMIGVTFFVIIMVVSFALVIFWRSRRVDPFLEELLIRRRDAQPAPKSQESSKMAEPLAEWERPADWWKNPAD